MLLRRKENPREFFPSLLAHEEKREFKEIFFFSQFTLKTRRRGINPCSFRSPHSDWRPRKLKRRENPREFFPPLNLLMKMVRREIYSLGGSVSR